MCTYTYRCIPHTGRITTYSNKISHSENRRKHIDISLVHSMMGRYYGTSIHCLWPLAPSMVFGSLCWEVFFGLLHTTATYEVVIENKFSLGATVFTTYSLLHMFVGWGTVVNSQAFSGQDHINLCCSTK